MANKKISAMTELATTPASGDKVPLVDVSDTTGAATGTTKWVSVDNLVSEIAVADMAASAVVTESEGIGSSDNDTSLPTSAAVKDYVDTNVTAQDLDFQGDSGGALAIDLDSESLTIAGGTGISTVGSSNTVTASIDSTVATLTGSQTLTNKTLTSPVIDTGVSGSAVLDSDAMSGASATTLATSESIKAYVDGSHLALGTTSSTALAGDTTTISAGQATAITDNTAKTGITTSQASAITANTAKVTNATHTGEVTGSTALTVADDTIDEANLKADNSPTDDYVLTAKSSAAGGLSWTEVSGGGGGGGSGDITSVAAGTGLTGGATSGAATLNVIGGVGITANANDIEHTAHTGDVTGATDLTIVAGAVDIAHLSASGLAGSSNFLRGDNTWVTPTDTNTMGSGFTVNATTNTTPSTITESDTLLIAAGAGITTTATADGTVTIANTVTDTNTMGSGFTVNATTNTTPSTITESDTLLIAAGTGITTTATSDGTVTIANTVTNTDTKWDGGATGLTAGTGRTSLGLVIGTDVQAYDSTIVVDADIGTSVQAYDADTAKLAATQTWTKAQIPSTRTAAFEQPDFDTYQNFVFTLTDGTTHTLTNPTTDASNAGQTGVIVLIQPSSGTAATLAITASGDFKPVGGVAPTLSTVLSSVDILPYMIQADNTILLGAPQLDFKATS